MNGLVQNKTEFHKLIWFVSCLVMSAVAVIAAGMLPVLLCGNTLHVINACVYEIGGKM